MPRQGHQTPRIRVAILFGVLSIFLLVGSLAAWSVLAPLESAAMAPGYVSAEMNRKTISHLEGGIIRSILVREGEKVTRGQKLVVLDPVQATANLDIRRARQVALQARAARLLAEKNGWQEINFPESIRRRSDDAKVKDVLNGEIAIFESHQKTLRSQTSILEQQKIQVRELIAGLQNGIKARNKQLEVLREQIDLYQGLLKKGLTQKPRVLELQGREAEVEGQKSQNQAEIARAKQRMGELDLRISDLQAEQRKKAAEDLGAIEGQLVEFESQISSAQDILSRTVVTAPIDGTVIALKAFTVGGVIGPGDPIMHIVPAHDRLLVDAKVDPRDIDVVKPGLLARVRLTAYQRRHVRPLEGRVLSVSADRLVEDRTGESYYLARIDLTESPGDVLKGAVLQPGMAAEVIIVTGAHTALEYLLEPITRTFNAAFRES